MFPLQSTTTIFYRKSLNKKKTVLSSDYLPLQTLTCVLGQVISPLGASLVWTVKP